MSKSHLKIDIKDIILIIIIVLLIIINLVLLTKKVIVNEKNIQENYEPSVIVDSGNNKQNQNISIPQTEEETIKYLSTLNERSRMQYYCGKYFKHIEHKEYEQAYNILYSEFKQKYFPTLEDFEKYVQEFYPEYFALEYDDITRQGNIYVLRLKIINIQNTTEEELTQRIVLQEKYYNDFVISFQVK